MEKFNVPEMEIIYVNLAYFSNKYGKKKYSNLLVISQVTPMPNPEDLENYVPEEDEVKILRPKHDVVSGQFLELVEILVYLTVQGNI